MYQISDPIDNDDTTTLASLGTLTVLEYQHDLSVMPQDAQIAYFANAMNVRKHQVMCDLSKASGGVTLQAGAMQRTMENANATTGVKGVGDLLSKAVYGEVTGELAVKPECTRSGTLVLRPTYHHILLIDLQGQNSSIVLNDGLSLVCESTLEYKAIMRSNFLSAAAGGEGLFNLDVNSGDILYLESACPRGELVEIMLQDDILKVDGNMAIAWGGNSNFTAERSGKSLIGSAVSDEGLINVFRGTGKALLAPVAQGIT